MQLRARRAQHGFVGVVGVRACRIVGEPALHIEPRIRAPVDDAGHRAITARQKADRQLREYPEGLGIPAGDIHCQKCRGRQLRRAWPHVRFTKAGARTAADEVAQEVAQEVVQEVARTQEAVDTQEAADIRAHREAAAARNTAAGSTVAAGNSGNISGPTAPLDAILAGKDVAHRHST